MLSIKPCSNGHISGYSYVYARRSQTYRRNSPWLIYLRIGLGGGYTVFDSPLIIRYDFGLQGGDSPGLNRLRVWLTEDQAIIQQDEEVAKHSIMVNEPELFDLMDDVAKLIIHETRQLQLREVAVDPEEILKKYDAADPKTLLNREKVLMLRDLLIRETIAQGRIPPREEWGSNAGRVARRSGPKATEILNVLVKLDQRLDRIEAHLARLDRPKIVPQPVKKCSLKTAPSRPAGLTDMELRGDGFGDALAFSDNKM